MELFTKPLVDDQVAPIGYLLLTRELVRWFGPTDTVLRMPSFVHLNPHAARLCDPRAAGPFTQGPGCRPGHDGVFFLAEPFVYACRAKPYSSDVLVAVILLSTAFWAFRRPPTLPRYAAMAIVGILAILFSLPAVFILGEWGPCWSLARQQGAAQEVDRLVRRRWPLARRFRRDLPHVPSAGHNPVMIDWFARLRLRTVPAAIDC